MLCTMLNVKATHVELNQHERVFIWNVLEHAAAEQSATLTVEQHSRLFLSSAPTFEAAGVEVGAERSTKRARVADSQSEGVEAQDDESEPLRGGGARRVFLHTEAPPMTMYGKCRCPHAYAHAGQPCLNYVTSTTPGLLCQNCATPNLHECACPCEFCMPYARSGAVVTETHATSNEEVDGTSHHSTSTNLGLAADSVAQADYDMASSASAADEVPLCAICLDAVEQGENAQRIICCAGHFHTPCLQKYIATVAFGGHREDVPGLYAERPKCPTCKRKLPSLSTRRLLTSAAPASPAPSPPQHGQDGADEQRRPTRARESEASGSTEQERSVRRRSLDEAAQHFGVPREELFYDAQGSLRQQRGEGIFWHPDAYELQSMEERRNPTPPLLRGRALDSPSASRSVPSLLAGSDARAEDGVEQMVVFVEATVAQDFGRVRPGAPASSSGPLPPNSIGGQWARGDHARDFSLPFHRLMENMHWWRRRLSEVDDQVTLLMAANGYLDAYAFSDATEPPSSRWLRNNLDAGDSCTYTTRPDGEVWAAISRVNCARVRTRAALRKHSTQFSAVVQSLTSWFASAIAEQACQQLGQGCRTGSNWPRIWSAIHVLTDQIRMGVTNVGRYSIESSTVISDARRHLALHKWLTSEFYASWDLWLHRLPGDDSESDGGSREDDAEETEDQPAQAPPNVGVPLNVSPPSLPLVQRVYAQSLLARSAESLTLARQETELAEARHAELTAELDAARALAPPALDPFAGSLPSRVPSPPPPPVQLPPAVPNEEVDGESMYSTSRNLGNAADSVAQADYDMASVHRTPRASKRNHEETTSNEIQVIVVRTGSQPRHRVNQSGRAGRMRDADPATLDLALQAKGVLCDAVGRRGEMWKWIAHRDDMDLAMAIGPDGRVVGASLGFYYPPLHVYLTHATGVKNVTRGMNVGHQLRVAQVNLLASWNMTMPDIVSLSSVEPIDGDPTRTAAAWQTHTLQKLGYALASSTAARDVVIAINDAFPDLGVGHCLEKEPVRPLLFKYSSPSSPRVEGAGPSGSAQGDEPIRAHRFALQPQRFASVRLRVAGLATRRDDEIVSAPDSDSSDEGHVGEQGAAQGGQDRMWTPRPPAGATRTSGVHLLVANPPPLHVPWSLCDGMPSALDLAYVAAGARRLVHDAAGRIHVVPTGRQPSASWSDDAGGLAESAAALLPPPPGRPASTSTFAGSSRQPVCYGSGSSHGTPWMGQAHACFVPHDTLDAPWPELMAAQTADNLRRMSVAPTLPHVTPNAEVDAHAMHASSRNLKDAAQPVSRGDYDMSSLAPKVRAQPEVWTSPAESGLVLLTPKIPKYDRYDVSIFMQVRHCLCPVAYARTGRPCEVAIPDNANRCALCRPVCLEDCECRCTTCVSPHRRTTTRFSMTEVDPGPHYCQPASGASSSSALPQEVIQFASRPAEATPSHEPRPYGPPFFRPAWARAAPAPQASSLAAVHAVVRHQTNGSAAGPIRRHSDNRDNAHPYLRPAYGAAGLRDDQISHAKAFAQRLANDRSDGRINAPLHQLEEMALAVAEARADGINPRTASKDDFAMREFTEFARLTGFDPNLQTAWTKKFPERESLKLASFLLFRAQRSIPRSNKDAVSKPMSIYQNYLALRRVFRGRDVELTEPHVVRQTLRGLIRRFMRRYGIDNLRPKRVEPVTPPMIRKAVALADEGVHTIRGKKWDIRENKTCFMVTAWMVINLAIGSRKGESTKLPHDVDENDWFTRFSVTVEHKGRMYTDPSPAIWASLEEGDYVLVAPKGSKCDQYGHGTEPVVLPFHDDQLNAAKWIRDLEVLFPSRGEARKRTPLFADDSNQPFTDGTFAAYIKAVLEAVVGKTRATYLSPHSWRVWLASSLRMCGATDARIQALGRWLNPESIKIYARMSRKEYAEWVDKMMSVKHIDTARTTNLPVMERADALAIWGQELHDAIDLSNAPEGDAPTPQARRTPTWTGNAPTAHVAPSPLQAGDRVSVYWTDMREWFAGVFTSSRVDSSDDGGLQRSSRVVYDATGPWARCNTKDLTYWHCLDDEQWRKE